MKVHPMTCVAAMAIATLLAHPAQAGQAQAQQPGAEPQAPRVAPPASAYRGLFGAGSPARPGGHILAFTATISQEYADTRNQDVAADQLVLDTGWFTSLRGALSYQSAGRHTRFGLRADGSTRYYSDSRTMTSPRFHAEIGLDNATEGRRRSTTHFGGSVDYEPYYVLSLFSAPVPVTEGAAVLPTSRDDLLYPQRRYIFGQSFGFERSLSPRSFISVSEDARVTKASVPGSDVRTIRAAVRLGHRLSRYAALRIGYGYQWGTYGPAAEQRLDTHDIELSLDYRRPLLRSRRTTFGFGSGSRLVTAESRRQWRIVGAANLRHEFDAGWFMQGDFARDVQLVEGFASPLFVNTATASVGGFLGRRLELLTAGAYSRGVVGFTDDPYWAVQGSARMRVAVARFMAIDAEGLWTHHEFDSHTVLPAAFPSQVNRWSVRFNVSFWLPLSR